MKRTAKIIAHVDDGKTTLVDGMLEQARVFRENQHSRLASDPLPPGQIPSSLRNLE